MPDSRTPPLRGRRGRDRRIGDQVATDFAARHAPADDEGAIDFDVAEVDAEVEDAQRHAEREAASTPAATPSAAPRRRGPRPTSGTRSGGAAIASLT